MRGLYLTLLLVGLSQAVQVYLNPAPSIPSTSLSPELASVTLSHHLGVEFFESLGGDDETELSDFGYEGEQSFVGQGPKNGLLLSLNLGEVEEHGA